MRKPLSDIDQLRFASIRGRMIENAMQNLPSIYMEHSGAKSREELREKIIKSDSIMALIECCAYEALCIEWERKSGRR